MRPGDAHGAGTSRPRGRIRCTHARGALPVRPARVPVAARTARRALSAAPRLRMPTPSASSCSERSPPGRAPAPGGRGRRSPGGAAPASLAQTTADAAPVARPRGRRSSTPCRSRPSARRRHGSTASTRARGRRRGRRAQPRPSQPSHKRRRSPRPRGLSRAGARDQGRLGRRRAGRRWALAVRARAPARSRPGRRPPARRRAPGGISATNCVRAACSGGRERGARLRGARTAGARRPRPAGRLSHASIELDRAFASALTELAGEKRHDLAVRVAELEKLHDRCRARGRDRADAHARRGRCRARARPARGGTACTGGASDGGACACRVNPRAASRRPAAPCVPRTPLS